MPRASASIPRLLRIGSAALLLIGPAGLADAQQGSTGAISGVVSDETGARLPGVTVSAESPAHIRAERTVSDALGRFRIGGLTPGVYTLVAGLSGFADTLQDGVRVEVGREYRVDIEMRVAPYEERVTVVGVAPTVDARSSTNKVNYQFEFLQNIPQPRGGTGADILRLAPGVDASTSIGGSTGLDATAWVFDGVDVSDPGSGSQFPFYNYDYIEEAEIIRYGAPPEYGKFAGAVFNVVTKSGGIDYAGSANLYYTGGGLVADNIDEVNDRFESSPAFAPLEADDVEQRWDMTFNVGGPIVENRIHFFGSFQQIVDDTTEAGTSDVRTDRSTRLIGKLNWLVHPNHRISGFYEFDRFPIDGRFPVGFLAPDPNTGVKEPSPNTTPRVHWQYSLNANALLEVQYSGFYGFFDLEPRTELPGILDFGPYAIYQSYYGSYHFGRQRTQVNSDYTQYVDGFAGTHVFKVGAGYEHGITDDDFRFGRNALGNNVLYYAYFGEIYGGNTRLGEFDNKTVNKVFSFYAQDSWTLRERLTLNLGLRYDRSTAHYATPDVDAFTFHDLAPRLFATYDVSGQGRTAVKGGWGRYYEALFGDLYDDFDPGLPRSAFFVFNRGPGGCGQSVPGFPNVGGGPECFSGIDAANVDVVSIADPNATIALDPDLKNHYVDQWYVGFEHELARDWAVGASFIRKTDGNLFGGRDDRSLYVDTTIEDPLTRSQVPAFFRVSAADEVLEVLTNRDDLYRRQYNGLEVLVRKRFRDVWQAMGSWTLQKAQGSHDNDTDSATTFRGSSPNHLINTDGELLNSRRHVLKLQGSYRVPVADVLLGATYTHQSGRPYNRIIRARLPDRVDVLAEPRGSRRRDALNELNVRAEKIFAIRGSEIGIFADVFNLLNESTVTFLVETTGDAFELPTRVSEPRVVQVGVRWIF